MVGPWVFLQLNTIAIKMDIVNHIKGEGGIIEELEIRLKGQVGIKEQVRIKGL